MNAIFYKEWIKTRWYLLLALLVTLGFAGYSMLRINRVASMKGVEHVWEVMLARDTVFVDLLEFIPLLVGILLALVQFVPEMHHKCLKLTLHLPYPQLRMINLMLLYGLVVLLICFAANYLLMTVYMQGVLAPELYSRILLTVLPWYLAGIDAYDFMDMPRTDLETPRPQSGNLCIAVAYLFPGSGTGSLQRFPALAGNLHPAHGKSLMALHCTVQGRRTRLTGYTFTIKNEKDNETF